MSCRLTAHMSNLRLRSGEDEYGGKLGLKLGSKLWLGLRLGHCTALIQVMLDFPLI